MNFDQVGINNVMTHVLVLSAIVRRIERSWQILNIGDTFGLTFGFKNS